MAEEKNIKTNGEDEKTKKINELGRKLKELREAQGITLEHASDATKIQKKYISAIEEGRLDELPKGPYCRSFLRQYCAFLTAPDMWAKYDPLTRGGNVTLEDFKASNEEPDMAVDARRIPPLAALLDIPARRRVARGGDMGDAALPRRDIYLRDDAARGRHRAR